jgi:hypothetical protein
MGEYGNQYDPGEQPFVNKIDFKIRGTEADRELGESRGDEREEVIAKLRASKSPFENKLADKLEAVGELQTSEISAALNQMDENFRAFNTINSEKDQQEVLELLEQLSSIQQKDEYGRYNYESMRPIAKKLANLIST